MGYRLELRRLEYDREVKSGARLGLKMWWVNSGVAPVYRPYQVAVELRSAAAGAAMRLPGDLQSWVPGDYVLAERPLIPPSLGPGTYRLRVAVVEPESGAPAIQLGIAGRQPDGWYDLGEVIVQPR